MNLPDLLIELLYDRREGWWALDELAQAAGASATRLAAGVGELEARGHRVEQHPTAGLRLLRPAGLDAHLIERGLGTRRLGRHAICFAELDSTNDTASASARRPTATAWPCWPTFSDVAAAGTGGRGPARPAKTC